MLYFHLYHQSLMQCSILAPPISNALPATDGVAQYNLGVSFVESGSKSSPPLITAVSSNSFNAKMFPSSAHRDEVTLDGFLSRSRIDSQTLPRFSHFRGNRFLGANQTPEQAQSRKTAQFKDGQNRKSRKQARLASGQGKNSIPERVVVNLIL